MVLLKQSVTTNFRFQSCMEKSKKKMFVFKTTHVEGSRTTWLVKQVESLMDYLNNFH